MNVKHETVQPHCLIDIFEASAVDAGHADPKEGMDNVQSEDDLKEGPELQVDNGDGPKDLPGEG